MLDIRHSKAELEPEADVMFRALNHYIIIKETNRTVSNNDIALFRLTTDYLRKHGLLQRT